MQDDKFSLFVPVDIIEKGNEEKDADGLPKRLLIGGVASNSNTGFDKDNQLLKVDGFDYQPLLKSGFLNLEHGYIKTKDASLIVGVPTDAFIKNGEFHIQGELFKDNPKAVAMYKLGQTLKKAGSSRRIGYSVEGHPTEFDSIDKRIIKSARITGLALTLSPKCAGTHLFIKGGEIEFETQEGSQYLVDIVDDNGQRVVVDKDLNIFKGEEIEKAMQAGSVTGRETTDQAMTGEPLKQESLDGVPKKKRNYAKMLEDMRKRKGGFAKAEVFTYLIEAHSMDIESCKNFWNLSAQIQKSLDSGMPI